MKDAYDIYLTITVPLVIAGLVVCHQIGLRVGYP